MNKGETSIPRVSIIMPTYNKAEFLELTLGGFALQSFRDFELIIIDDGSTDYTSKVVEKYKERCNINYVHQQNSGRSRARNKALGLAKGRYLIFNDDDRIPVPSFIEEHVNALIAKPEAVSIGSKYDMLTMYSERVFVRHIDIVELIKRNEGNQQRLLYGESKMLFSGEELIEDFEGTINNWLLRESSDNFADLIKEFSEELIDFHLGWIMATTGNMAVDRAVLDGVSFDESYVGWGIEDTDFAYQLYNKGISFRHTKKATSYHQLHPRARGQYKDFKNNVKRFCNKDKRVEPYLFIQILEGQLTFKEANELLKQLNKHKADILYSNYIKICHAHIEKQA